MSAQDVITSFWNELFQEEFDIASFAEELLAHFGHDGWRLSADDVVMALRSEDGTPSRNIGWSCRECFLCFDGERADSKKNFIAYLAMTCLWSDAVVRNQSEMGCDVDWIVRMAYLNLEHGSAYSRLRWFRYLFRESPTSSAVSEDELGEN